MHAQTFQPLGTPGVPWGDAEKAQWRARQRKQRSHADDVLTAIDALRTSWEVVPYGELDCGDDGRFPLLALRSLG